LSLEPDLACKANGRVAFRVSLPKVSSFPISVQRNGCRQPCRVAQHWHARSPLTATCRSKRLDCHSVRRTGHFSLLDHTAFGTSAHNVYSTVEHSLPSPLNVSKNPQRLIITYLTGLAFELPLFPRPLALHRTVSPKRWLLLKTF
jgi:hypothetical protein